METRTERDEARGSAPERSRKGSKEVSGQATAVVRKVRSVLAQAVWLFCLLAAIVLAVGALLVVLKANTDNPLVKAILDLADKADLGLFDRTNGIKQFHGHNAEIKDALFNWGLGAIAWLVVGRLLERIIRP